MKKKLWRIPLGIILAVIIFCAIYVSNYYHATDHAKEFLKGTDAVAVSDISGGLLFDGPGDETALIFYPGAKVEYTAYAPLMCELAGEGMDCFLVKMPCNLAFLGKNKADGIIEVNDYSRWIIGGHSLGGVMAAEYAAENDLDGLVLLAAYPTEKVDEPTLEFFGTEDGVLNMEKLEEEDRYLPENNMEVEIRGGNHAQFGDYGVQRGDGKATIAAEAQQNEVVNSVIDFFEITY